MSTENENLVTQEMCTATSSQLLNSQDNLHRKLDSIEKRLFRDNGSVSIQTRLDRHEQVIRGMLWGISVVGGALLTSVVVGVIVLMRTVLLRGVA